MRVVYEDDNIIVIHKESGEPTQTAKGSTPDVVSKLKVHMSKTSGKKGDSYVGVIHRLDQPVEGLLVFAKDKASAATLSNQVQSDLMNKVYTATVEGIISADTRETLVDFMYKDSKESRAVIVNGQALESNRDAKKAELSYAVISNDDSMNTSVLKVKLKTGRFHQIRAQLSNMGHPIIGDVKYGAEKKTQKGISLIASELDFVHPKTKKKMHFEI